MPAILSESLSKVYRVAKRQPGAMGAIKSVFKPNYTNIEALTDVTLSIDQGEVVGFLGPNGAGKTTAIKILTGIMYPTSGTARVLGYEPWKKNPDMLRRISLVMGNKQQLWWDLPAIESFRVLKEIYEVSDSDYKTRLDRLVEALQLSAVLDQQVRKMSLGERMKCELVAALLHEPEVVFLDEPTIGLDLVSQKRIREFLRDFNKETGCTILLTSHYMQDVQELAKRVVIIDHGKLIFDGDVPTLMGTFGSLKHLTVLVGGSDPMPNFEQYGTVLSLEGRTATISIAKEAVPAIASSILNDLPVLDLAVEEVSIEEVVRSIFQQGR